MFSSLTTIEIPPALRIASSSRSCRGGRFVFASLTLDANERTVVTAYNVGYATAPHAVGSGEEIVNAFKFQQLNYFVFYFFLRSACHVR